MKILFLNGPPHCGKDYTGKLVTEISRGPSYRIDKFARALKETCHAAYGVMVDGKPAPHDHFESFKDKPRSEFFGKTPREVYIAFSETYMKPLHGQRIWGEMLLRSTLAAPPVDWLIITDSGFRPEAEVFVEQFGAKTCTLLRIHRPGCDFSGDSRSYVNLADLGVRQKELHNPGDRDGLIRNLMSVLQ